MLVNYGHAEWHERVVGPHIDGANYPIATADLDFYIEELAPTADGIQSMRFYRSGGVLPPGIDGNNLIAFGPMPQGDRTAILRELRQMAIMERARLGVPALHFPSTITASGIGIRRFREHAPAAVAMAAAQPRPVGGVSGGAATAKASAPRLAFWSSTIAWSPTAPHLLRPALRRRPRSRRSPGLVGSASSSWASLPRWPSSLARCAATSASLWPRRSREAHLDSPRAPERAPSLAGRFPCHEPRRRRREGPSWPLSASRRRRPGDPHRSPSLPRPVARAEPLLVGRLPSRTTRPIAAPCLSSLPRCRSWSPVNSDDAASAGGERCVGELRTSRMA